MNDKQIKRAAALKYDQAKNMAPRVVAKGKGHIAEQIVRVARDNDVPLLEDPNLANVLEAMDLAGDADRLIREFSQGMRRKSALAAALLGDPKVIVLDESLNGLDPPSAARVKALLRARVDAGATVLLSTHVVDTVEKVADRVVMMAHGRVVVDADTSTLPEGGLEALFLEKLEAARAAGE